MDDNFNFNLITEFTGYVSSRDKTNVKATAIVKNSKNVYKKLSGTMANRPGLKAYGPLDGTAAAVLASYVWNSNFGKTRVIRVTADNRLSVLFNGAWYDLMTGLTKTRFIFDSWYEFDEGKDRVVMVNGDANIYHWSGGIALTGAPGAFRSVISAVAVNAQGSGYSTGDTITVTQAGASGAVIQLTAFNGNVTGFTILNPGTGYVTANGLATVAITGVGTGLTVNITTINGGTLATSDGSTWSSNGFASEISGEKTFKIGAQAYTYTGGEGTPTLQGVSPDPSLIALNSVAVQVMQTASNFTAGQNNYGSFTIGTTNDFVKILNGQMFLASFSSRVVYISAQSQTGLNLAFTDFSNKGDLIPGDPDLIVLDNAPTGMTPKEGHMYISAGTSDWYVVTPNTPIPLSVPLTAASSPIRLVTTDVQKITGTALVAALGPEFIENVAGDVFYVSQDHQLRKLGTIPNFLNVVKFPSLSQDLQDELVLENLTGGHLRAIGEFLYITAPATGRHYMHQTRERIEVDGAISAERIWHAPQASGLSRFEAIAGTTYGFSNSNPMLYQIWDTGQWHDDGVDSGNSLVSLPYQCVLALAYHQMFGKGKEPLRFSKQRFDKLAVEGYILPGTPLYANLYYDYQGSTFIKGVYVNGVPTSQDLQTDSIKYTKAKAKLFSYTDAPSLGQDFLGDNPIGQGITPFPAAQDYLPKFRTICKVPLKYCYEHQVELYSYDEDARWEVLSVGTNTTIAPEDSGELTR